VDIQTRLILVDADNIVKAKYRADAKGISGELRGLQGTGIPATEKGELLKYVIAGPAS
jgi:hypothetical protein